MKWTFQSNKNNLNSRNLNTIESSAFNWENNSDICQYQNSDTKNIEYSIVFLKKILLMKYFDNIKYEDKANLYAESLVHLQKYPIEYIKCSFLVAISLFKSKKFPQAIEKLNEISVKLKNQIAQISINEDVKLSPNLAFEYNYYINEFSNLSCFLTLPAKQSFELNMMFQNCFYIIGLVDWVWFKEVKAMNKRKETHNDNLDLNKKELKQIDYFLIDKGIKAFTNAIEVNHLIKANLLKNIWLNIMLSKCEYEKEQYQKSNWYLQEAFIQLIDFNNYLITSNILLSEKTIILINGLLLQYILYQFGKLMVKIKKCKTACEVFILCIEISLFKIEKIHINCFVKISKLLKEKCRNEIRIMKKISQRLNPDYPEIQNKSIVILTSFELVNYYDLVEELKDALIKYTSRLFDNENDYIGYIEVGVYQTKVLNLNPVNTFCEEFQKKYETNKILTNDTSINTQYYNSYSQSNNYDSSNGNNSKIEKLFSDNNLEYYDGNIYQGIMKSISMLTEVKNNINADKYIFIFGISKIINFSENEQWINVRNVLHQENISLYVFCFENEIPETEKENIIKYLKKDNLIEGILFTVNSLKIIKKAFQNITTKGKKRVFTVCYDDIYNID